MKKTVLAFAFAFVQAALGFGQLFQHETIKVWPGEVPGSKEAKAEHEYNNHRSDGNRVTKVTDPTLEIFTPSAENDNHKAVIVCPGGAYALLAYKKEGQEIAEWLTKQGYTAYVLAYRVPNQRLGALQDAQRSIRIARHRGAEQVGIIGFSAGASLSCRAATRWGETLYPAQDGTDMASCRPDFGILIYPAYLDEGENKTLTPELTVTEQTPPLFVFGTEDDVMYSGPSCITIVGAMQKAGAPIELHYLPKGGHGYGMRQEAGLIWPSLCEKWLKTSTKQVKKEDKFTPTKEELDKYLPELKAGSKAPKLAAKDTLGNNVTLAQFKGKYVVLDMWATWCGDCRREIPALKQLHAETYDKTIGGKQIQWLSMSFDTDANAWKNILKKEQFTWPQISNLKSTKQDPTFNNWKLHWIPAFFVISPKGEIVGSAITADGLRDILVPLIK